LSKKENREVPENKEKRVEPRERKEIEPIEGKGKANMSFYANESEVKKAFLADQPMIFLIYKESYLILILMKLTNLFLVWLFLCYRSF
jgi:hypothetical protein